MRKFLLIMALSLISVTSVYATETWESQNNEAVIVQEVPETNNGSVTQNNNITQSQSGGGLGLLQDAFSGGVAKYDSNIVGQTQAITSKGTSWLYSLFFGSIGFIIFSKIIFSLIAISFEPLRPLLGATQGSSGSGLDGGNGKTKIKLISNACTRAIQKAEGGSGGGLDGGDSKGSAAGNNVYLIYLREEMFGIICFFIAIMLLLLPVGWDLLMVFVEFFYGLFEGLVSGLRANIL